MCYQRGPACPACGTAKYWPYKSCPALEWDKCGDPSYTAWRFREAPNMYAHHPDYWWTFDLEWKQYIIMDESHRWGPCVKCAGTRLERIYRGWGDETERIYDTWRERWLRDPEADKRDVRDRARRERERRARDDATESEAQKYKATTKASVNQARPASLPLHATTTSPETQASNIRPDTSRTLINNPMTSAVIQGSKPNVFRKSLSRLSHAVKSVIRPKNKGTRTKLDRIRHPRHSATGAQPQLSTRTTADQNVKTPSPSRGEQKLDTPSSAGSGKAATSPTMPTVPKTMTPSTRTPADLSDALAQRRDTLTFPPFISEVPYLADDELSSESPERLDVGCPRYCPAVMLSSRRMESRGRAVGSDEMGELEW